MFIAFKRWATAWLLGWVTGLAVSPASFISARDKSGDARDLGRGMYQQRVAAALAPAVDVAEGIAQGRGRKCDHRGDQIPRAREAREPA